LYTTGFTVKPGRLGDSSNRVTTNPDCFSRLSTLHGAQRPVCGQGDAVSAGDAGTIDGVDGTSATLDVSELAGDFGDRSQATARKPISREWYRDEVIERFCLPVE
jgi:hypothetical protein